MRGRRPRPAGPPLTAAPWWFGPGTLTAPGEGTPFDLVLLDRDGTLNVRVPDAYVTRPDELQLLPGASEAVAALTAAGCRTVVVTNQRGIARGLMDRTDLLAVHARLRELLAADGGRIDAIAVCPHERGACRCRKPLDGLLVEALRRAPWADPARCVVVGDMPSDLEPAIGLGMRAERVGPPGPDAGAVVARILAT